MNYYSSYYAKANNSRLSNVLWVQVSNTSPDWFSKDLYKPYHKVSPEWNLINSFKNHQITYEDFCVRYTEWLQQRPFKPTDFRKELELAALDINCDAIVILCWEKADCHRFPLADWFCSEDYVGELL